MNRLEHLLTILTEECAEVQQATTKALRFGLDEGRDIKVLNSQRMNLEMNDLFAVIEMINDEVGQFMYRDSRLLARKIEKVEKYLSYSKECGTLTD